MNDYYVKVLIAEPRWITIKADNPEDASEQLMRTPGVVWVLEVSEKEPEEC